VRVRAVDTAGRISEPSDVYSGTGSQWLVVDGFDRVTGGSFLDFTHDFGASLANALGGVCSSASNEAVSLGHVDLSAYDGVLWILGDESKADITFDAGEKAAIEDYLAVGGRLIVTGSEVGYATASDWLSSVLHTTYVKDDAGTTKAGGYTFGVTYPEDYPDVLSSSTTLWSYDVGGGAAVGWNNRVVVVGFPLETMSAADQEAGLQELVTWLNVP
jgi:hypothetical protein